MDAQFDLSFTNLSYEVGSKIPFDLTKKKILKNVCGEFRSKELTAVVGLSGSGKSTLLDCLSGFKKAYVSGEIAINQKVRSIRQVSSYVMQEQTLHMLLSVREIMCLSLNLRDRRKLRNIDRKSKINDVLKKLHIEGKCHSLVRDLSGGEKKRLQIAVELVNDPKIIFLDEPTTGLDNVSSTHCVKLLKNLALEGRTIVCSIHQPSALLLKMFDQIYALASGQCIYQGSFGSLIDFLNQLDLPCPPSYNPADFLLEIANNDYGLQNERLTEKIQNGRNFDFKSAESLNNKNNNSIIRDYCFEKNGDCFEEVPSKMYASSFVRQVSFLMMRMYLITSRDLTHFYLRVLIHLVLGVVFGFIYRDVGSKGSAMLDNYRYLVVSVVFLLYTSFHSLFVTFPLEFPIIKREHFNGWYSTSAYYTSFVLSDVPITLLCCFSYVSITFYLTEQPRELYRFAIFLSFTLITSFAAQSLGICCTALLNIKMATIFGSMFLMPFFLFSGVMILTKDAPEIFEIFFRLNFLDNGLKGVLNSVLGFNRTKLDCDDLIYCHFGDPKKVLSDFGATVDMYQAISILMIYICTTQILSFLMMRYRLKNRQS